MIEAADILAFDPARIELGAAVRAPKGNRMDRAALAAIEREVFIHDAQRLGPANRYVFGAIGRHPERSEEAPGNRAGPGVNEIVHIDSDVGLNGFGAAYRHPFHLLLAASGVYLRPQYLAATVHLSLSSTP